MIHCQKGKLISLFGNKKHYSKQLPNLSRFYFNICLQLQFRIATFIHTKENCCSIVFGIMATPNFIHRLE